MKIRLALALATMSMNAACIAGCAPADDAESSDDATGSEDIADAESALTGAEVIDQQQTSFNGGGLPWGHRPDGPGHHRCQ